MRSLTLYPYTPQQQFYLLPWVDAVLTFKHYLENRVNYELKYYLAKSIT